MRNRVLGPFVAVGLLACAGETLVATQAFGYQEFSCRRSCLASQLASMKRCRSNCYQDRAGARFYCYNLCVGRGH